MLQVDRRIKDLPESVLVACSLGIWLKAMLIYRTFNFAQMSAHLKQTKQIEVISHAEEVLMRR